MTFPRANFASYLLNKKIYVFGGFTT